MKLYRHLTTFAALLVMVMLLGVALVGGSTIPPIVGMQPGPGRTIYTWHDFNNEGEANSKGMYAIVDGKLTPCTTKVTFINTDSKTVLGIVKFVVEKKMVPVKDPEGRVLFYMPKMVLVDYEVLNIRWDDEIKVLELEPGYYGVTQYLPEKDVITDYLNFWVYNVPITIGM